MWFHRRFKTRPEGEAMPTQKNVDTLKKNKEDLGIAEAAAKAKERVGVRAINNK
jgi:hypothetical protein